MFRLRAPGPLMAALMLVPGGGQGAAGSSGADVRAAVKQHVLSHQRAILQEYVRLLGLPNLASDPDGIRKNAEFVVAMLGRRGVAAELLDGQGGPPAVFGELQVGASRTLALYAHYDGQPVDPARWTSPPWSPVLRDGPLPGGRRLDLDSVHGPVEGEWRLFARSAADDKAPIVAIAAALDALAAAGARPAVNLKLLFEGEEERGSPHLPALLAANRDRLRADAWLLCDGPVHQSQRMQLYFGARGVTDVEVTLYGPARAVHSGHYGNWVPNPAVALAHLVAGLRDNDGHVAIPGFYDGVRPLTGAERAALAAVPDVDEALRDELALAATEAGGARLIERLMLPALNVRGLQAGTVGREAANAIPAVARASIDLRLVPDQRPARVRALFEAHLEARGFAVVHEEPSLARRREEPRLVRLDWGDGYPAARTAMDLPFSRRLVSVVGSGPRGPVVALPMLGGSIPMHLFADVSGAPVVGLPIVNHDNAQHAADENLRLQNLWDGILVFTEVLLDMGQGW